MAAKARTNGGAVFRILDVIGAPHGGTILRLRLQSGETPSIKRLKGSRLRAVGPDGEAERELHVEGFAVFGGRPSDQRLARTGRVDIHVTEQDVGRSGPPISPLWEVRGPID